MVLLRLRRFRHTFLGLTGIARRTGRSVNVVAVTCRLGRMPTFRLTRFGIISRILGRTVVRPTATTVGAERRSAQPRMIAAGGATGRKRQSDDRNSDEGCEFHFGLLLTDVMNLSRYYYYNSIYLYLCQVFLNTSLSFLFQLLSKVDAGVRVRVAGIFATKTYGVVRRGSENLETRADALLLKGGY